MLFRNSEVPNNVQGFCSALSHTSSVYSHKENLHVSLHNLWGHIIKIVKWNLIFIHYICLVSPNHVWLSFFLSKFFIDSKKSRCRILSSVQGFLNIDHIGLTISVSHISSANCLIFYSQHVVWSLVFCLNQQFISKGYVLRDTPLSLNQMVQHCFIVRFSFLINVNMKRDTWHCYVVPHKKDPNPWWKDLKRESVLMPMGIYVWKGT